MTHAGQALLALAVEQFSKLTDAEEKSLCKIAAGEVSDYEALNNAGNDPTHAEDWDASRTIRATIIRWLCVDHEAIRHVDPNGIRIDAAKIEGPLELASVTVPRPLSFSRCGIPHGVSLEYANTRTLSFAGSSMGTAGGMALRADGAHVNGSILLHSGFLSKSEVCLVGATITGDLVCEGGRFLNPGGAALSVDGAHIGGSVLLRYGFWAMGEVRLHRATITTMLDCEGGKFLHPKRTALDAEGVHVGGSVLMRTGFRAGSMDGSVPLRLDFHAEGEVRFHGATITGDLECDGGAFHNAGGLALTAEMSTIGGRVFLRRDFQAMGEVRLLGARITGELDCRMGIFRNPTGVALSAEGMQVGGPLFLSHGFRAEGKVQLMGARVGLLGDDDASWPAQGSLELDGFIYTGFVPNTPTDAKARLRWLKRQPRKPFRPQPYLQLAKVLRERGDEAGVKRVFIAKEWARRKHGSLGCWARYWNWLLCLTIGYGYRPYYALGWAALWVIAGGVLFGCGHQKEIVIPTKAEAYYTDKKTEQETAFYPTFRPFLYSLDTFVPIINFGQKDYWGPQVACNRSWLKGGSVIRVCICGTRALYLYRWVHIVVGWMLITLVITGFTNLVRKE